MKLDTVNMWKHPNPKISVATTRTRQKLDSLCLTLGYRLTGRVENENVGVDFCRAILFLLQNQSGRHI